jgi:hypothetical protein
VARIKQFRAIKQGRRAVGHRTDVECGYAILSEHGHNFLHLETYGSAGRVIPGKVSQTLLIDERAASKLRELLDVAFPRR